ncbi:MAG: RluA family pseudouridine synthase [Planctomycetes bacterium]|nr:RluA family pseudouridine synthase [Planctomycetota bacterium]MCC7169919.1 RluA family pseudouridine synthase [Planctomycetota bacterium]
MPTVFEVLRGLMPEASNNTLRGLVKDGRVTVGGRKAKLATEEVEPGARLLVLPKRTAVEHRLSPLTLVHEDDDIIVVDKPRGLLTSTTAREKRVTALQRIDEYLHATDRTKHCVAVHRLDRDACGLLVFAKSPRAVERLKRQFFEHTVERHYLAIVRGHPQPAEGRIDLALVERADGVVRPARPGDDAKEAATRYRTVELRGENAVLEVELETGRKHQIRAHLSALGHPLVGDEAYGGGKGVMLLCAVSLAFDHPIRPKRMRFEREPPPEMQSGGA